MTKVRFFRADGSLDCEIDSRPGERLLDTAWRANQSLEGACEGSMACSTCHVILKQQDFDKLPPASEEEDDLLDLAAHVCRTSRLACQLMVDDAPDPLDVTIPPGSANWMRR